ncbi:MAG: DNA-binding transcriptional regulator [Proteobacteria bacterium]|nr:DNA-binding transcriptional regulator [Pseudomonadota bacterium]
MPKTVGAAYRNVTALERGLQVLVALNRLPSGIGTVGSLAGATGLHRTTVKRLLETLTAHGFLRRSHSDDTYRLVARVRALSEGFTDDEWVSSAAMPELGELLKQLVWPSDLTTLDGDAMVIRETTHRFSSLSFHRNMVGRRIPLLNTASGRVYLAHCPPNELEQLLHFLARSADAEQARMARDARLVRHLLDKVRREGCGCNSGEWSVEPHVGGIAVPIIGNGKVLACLSVVFLIRVISVEDARTRFLPALAASAQRIERVIAGPA